jgi:hypothetical protein
MRSDHLEQPHRIDCNEGVCTAQKVLALLQQSKPHQKGERCIPPKSSFSQILQIIPSRMYDNSTCGIQNGILRDNILVKIPEMILARPLLSVPHSVALYAGTKWCQVRKKVVVDWFKKTIFQLH